MQTRSRGSACPRIILVLLGTVLTNIRSHEQLSTRCLHTAVLNSISCISLYFQIVQFLLYLYNTQTYLTCICLQACAPPRLQSRSHGSEAVEEEDPLPGNRATLVIGYKMGCKVRLLCLSRTCSCRTRLVFFWAGSCAKSTDPNLPSRSWRKDFRSFTNLTLNSAQHAFHCS